MVTEQILNSNIVLKSVCMWGREAPQSNFKVTN